MYDMKSPVFFFYVHDRELELQSITKGKWNWEEETLSHIKSSIELKGFKVQTYILWGNLHLHIL